MKVLKWLSVADRFAKTYLDDQLAPFGISSSQHMYLLKVCDHPGILQDSLIESVYVHPSNIVRMVAALEKKGFLTRSPYDKDKRTWQLFPTPKALSIAEEVRAACDRTESLLMDELSVSEKEVFDHMLLRIGKRLAKELNMERTEDEFDG